MRSWGSDDVCLRQHLVDILRPHALLFRQHARHPHPILWGRHVNRRFLGRRTCCLGKHHRLSCSGARGFLSLLFRVTHQEAVEKSQLEGRQLGRLLLRGCVCPRCGAKHNAQLNPCRKDQNQRKTTKKNGRGFCAANKSTLPYSPCPANSVWSGVCIPVPRHPPRSSRSRAAQLDLVLPQKIRFVKHFLFRDRVCSLYKWSLIIQNKSTHYIYMLIFAVPQGKDGHKRMAGSCNAHGRPSPPQ